MFACKKLSYRKFYENFNFRLVGSNEPSLATCKVTCFFPRWTNLCVFSLMFNSSYSLVVTSQNEYIVLLNSFLTITKVCQNNNKIFHQLIFSWKICVYLAIWILHTLNDQNIAYP